MAVAPSKYPTPIPLAKDTKDNERQSGFHTHFIGIFGGKMKFKAEKDYSQQFHFGSSEKMRFFVVLDNLEKLLRILTEVKHICLDYQPDKKEQREIEKILESIEAGMFKLQDILNKNKEKNL